MCSTEIPGLIPGVTLIITFSPKGILPCQSHVSDVTFEKNIDTVTEYTHSVFYILKWQKHLKCIDILRVSCIQNPIIQLAIRE